MMDANTKEMLDDINAEGLAILEEYNLEPAVPDVQEIKAMWASYDIPDNAGITRLAVKEARAKLKYDFRMLDWMWEWINFWQETYGFSRDKPSQADYILFFTIKGKPEINTKGTSFISCLQHLRTLEQGREREKNIRADAAAYRKEHPNA